MGYDTTFLPSFRAKTPANLGQISGVRCPKFAAVFQLTSAVQN
jgi:hypothetical protein